MEVKATALIVMMLGTLHHLEACNSVPNNHRVCVPSSQPPRRMLLTPDNIRYFASYLHSSVDIQDRVIHVGPGSLNEKLLEVPLGEIDPRATIIITVGLDKSHPNTPGTDSDINVGISDGTTDNTQYIVDANNYGSLPPCRPINAEHDDVLVSSGTPVPAIVKLIFTPFYKYGACETAQEGGYINTMTFNDQIDTSKPLFLRWFRDNAGEEYFVHFFDVEIYKPAILLVVK